MNWVSVPAGLILAAAVIPPLVLLYFLKLRRRPQPIACTLLWKKSIEDLRANAPFQRLRRSILLLLQLVTLILLALAIMQPQIEAAQRAGGKTIILIDNSASMTATDGPDAARRLDEAKRRAADRIETLHGRGLFAGGAGQTMVIAFSDRAEVMCPFTDSKQQLLSAIDRIRPTHGTSRIGEALTLARAYTTNVDPDSGEPVGKPGTLELFSDGKIADAADEVLRGETLIYHRVGSDEADNVAITMISIERPYDQPDAVEVFASLANYTTEALQADVQLSVNGNARAIEEVTLGPAENDPATGVLVPRRSNVVFTPFEQPQEAVIEVTLLTEDHLRADNAARLVVPPPKQLQVGLVGAKSLPITLVLGEMPAVKGVVYMDEAAYLQRAREGAIEEFDVVILDDYAPPADLMPPARYLSFGRIPPLEGLHVFGETEGQLVLDIRQEHPLFRFVELNDVFIAKQQLVEPGDDVVVLADGSGGPLMLHVSRGVMQALVVTFHPLDSSWPFLRSFPTFMVNAVEFVGRAGSTITAGSFAPGDALTTRLPASATDIMVQLPGAGAPTEDARPLDPELFSWGPARESGVYIVSWRETDGGARKSRPFAVNLLDEAEGDIRPADSVLAREGDDVVIAGAGGGRYMSLWPWAIGMCLLVIMLEWWVYHRKAYV